MQSALQLNPLTTLHEMKIIKSIEINRLNNLQEILYLHEKKI